MNLFIQNKVQNLAIKESGVTTKIQLITPILKLSDRGLQGPPGPSLELVTVENALIENNRVVLQRESVGSLIWNAALVLLPDGTYQDHINVSVVDGVVVFDENDGDLTGLLATFTYLAKKLH